MLCYAIFILLSTLLYTFILYFKEKKDKNFLKLVSIDLFDMIFLLIQAIIRDIVHDTVHNFKKLIHLNFPVFFTLH